MDEFPWTIYHGSMVYGSMVHGSKGNFSFLKADKYIYSEFEYYTPSVCLYIYYYYCDTLINSSSLLSPSLPPSTG